MERRSHQQTVDVRRRKLGAGMAVAGLVVAVTLLVAPAEANDDLAHYDDKVVTVSATRAHHSEANETTFTFTLELKAGTNRVGHILMAACPGPAPVTDSSGPPGSIHADGGLDPATGHRGERFEPGFPGSYQVTFTGNLGGADFIVKNGDGHKHYTRFSACSAVTTSTTGLPTSTTTTTPVPTSSSTTTTTTPPLPTSAPTTTTTALSDLARLKECERQAQTARIAYPTTLEMTVQQTSQVRVTASLADHPVDTSTTASGPSTTVVAVKLRCVVEAQLRGLDFDVDPEGFQTRSFLDQSEVVWSWDVVPQRTGKQKSLTLEIKAVADIGGKTYPGASRLYTTSINVDAEPETFGDKTERWSEAVVEHPLVKGLGPLIFALGTLAGIWRWLLKRPWPWKQPGGGQVRPPAPVVGGQGPPGPIPPRPSAPQGKDKKARAKAPPEQPGNKQDDVGAAPQPDDPEANHDER